LFLEQEVHVSLPLEVGVAIHLVLKMDVSVPLEQQLYVSPHKAM